MIEIAPRCTYGRPLRRSSPLLLVLSIFIAVLSLRLGNAAAWTTTSASSMNIITAITPIHTCYYGSSSCRSFEGQRRRASFLNSKEGGDDSDDGGWGSPSETPDSNKAVLESLKSERQQQQSQVGSSNSNNEELERDLFIPVFTLVSVVGFGGLYAYETVRLYMNGELYLPGGN